MDELKKQLAKEDEGLLRAGVTSVHEISPSMFLQQALKVEISQ